MKSLMVSAIQRYSIHDGHGIRTSVFFCGCPLRCPWCHNPESIFTKPAIFFNAERCLHCGACAAVCPSGAVSLDETHHLAYNRTACNACGLCVEQCPAVARSLTAKSYALDELISLLKRDRPFFEESGGGVTLSGGEVMVQSEETIDALLEALHRSGISVNIDTCGYAPWQRFERVLPWVHTFLYDLKAFDPDLHKRLTGRGNQSILKNLKALSDAGAVIDLRLPVIGGANDDLEDWENAADWLAREVHVHEIHLLPYHNTGGSKYARLGKTACDFSTPTPAMLRSLQEILVKHGFETPVIGG